MIRRIGRRGRAAVATLLVFAPLLAGCASSPAGPCGTATITLEATVTDEGMNPSALAVCRDQAVTLVLDSQTDATFHVHGLEDGVPATSLTQGTTTTLEFTPGTAGQFIIELHAHAGGGEIEAGVLTVHEP